MYDAHAHLTPKWIPNYLSVAKESLSEGLKGIINSAAEKSEYDPAIALTKKYPQIKAALGISPQLIAEHNIEDMIKYIDSKAKQMEIVAIGEIGLDYHWVKKPMKRQKQADIFIKGLKLANRYSLPVIIHSRDSDEDTFSILEDFAETPVILHSFSSNETFATRAINNGWYLSFSTAICYSKPKQRVAKGVPLENLLVETDSPFLHPTPGKGLKNKPSNVILAAEKLAAVKNISINLLEESIDENIHTLFSVE